jgi:hypothetical protein
MKEVILSARAFVQSVCLYTPKRPYKWWFHYDISAETKKQRSAFLKLNISKMTHKLSNCVQVQLQVVFISDIQGDNISIIGACSVKKQDLVNTVSSASA